MIQDITMGLFSFLQEINALFRSTLLLQSYLSEHWKSRKSCYPVISETVRGTGKPQDWKYWRTDKCTPILADSVTCISNVKITCANYLIWNPNFSIYRFTRCLQLCPHCASSLFNWHKAKIQSLNLTFKFTNVISLHTPRL